MEAVELQGTGGGERRHSGDVIDDDAWDELVQASPQGEIFHSSAWLHLLENVFDVHLTRLGVVSGREVVAGLPIFGRRVGPIGMLGSPLPGTSTPQMGPLMRDPAYLPEILESFKTVIRREHVSISEMICSGSIDRSLLAAAGFQTAPHPTMVLDLAGKSKDDAWKGFKSECRTACRKAEKLDVEVSTADDAAFLPDYLPMVDAVFAKQGREAPTTPAFYLALWQTLHPLGHLRVLFARYRREIVAGSMFLVYKRRLYYLDGASYPEHYGLRANDLIHWHIIQWAIDNGIEQYDMVGADAPGLIRFKRNFGAEIVEYQRARRVSSPMVDLALNSYLKIRPAVRRLKFKSRRRPSR